MGLQRGCMREVEIFTLSTCGPSNQLRSKLKKVPFEYTHHSVVANSTLAKSKGVNAVPMIILYDEGEEVRRIVGFSKETTILDEIKEFVNDS